MTERAVTPAAHNAEIGTPLRPQHPGWPHRVEAIRVTNAGNYVITTNQGEWEFRPGELMTFPRRASGETMDWRLNGRSPNLGEICYGDVLPEPLSEAERMVPPWTKDVWETATERQREDGMRQWRERGVRVSAITPAPKSDGHLFVITTRSVHHGNGRWFVRDDQPVETSLATSKSQAQYLDKQTREMVGYGPYELPDGKFAFMLRHPHGVGRWPAWLRHPIKIGGNCVVMRPPGKKDEWPSFLGCKRDGQLVHGFKYHRHPHDPKWGMFNEDKIVHERLIAEALETYENYKKMYERK